MNMDIEAIKQMATDVHNVAAASFQSGKEHVEKPLLAKIEKLTTELIGLYKEKQKIQIRLGKLEIADAFSQSPNLSLDDLINQFTEDLDFDALIGWADLFGIDHDYKSWFDDDYPDKESELRGQLAEAMNKVGKKPEIS